MKKRTILAALLVVPMGIALAEKQVDMSPRTGGRRTTGGENAEAMFGYKSETRYGDKQMGSQESSSGRPSTRRVTAGSDVEADTYESYIDIGEVKTQARKSLEKAEEAAMEMDKAANFAKDDLKPKYKTVANMAKAALVALEEEVAKTTDPLVAEKAMATTKKAQEAAEATVVAIKANNVAKAAEKAKAVADEIAETAKAVKAVAAQKAAEAVEAAAQDIKTASAKY